MGVPNLQASLNLLENNEQFCTHCGFTRRTPAAEAERQTPYSAKTVRDTFNLFATPLICS